MSKAHWLALTMLSRVGGVTVRKLIEQFGDIELVFDAPAEELLQVPRMTADIVAQLQSVSLPTLDAELLSLSDEGIDVLTWEDDDYPRNLLGIHDAPPLLFLAGELQPADSNALAIVGTRQPTPQAVEQADTLAVQLAERGLTIVSGLALGIDAAAHRGALSAPDGRTLAVLGSGIRHIHPRENVELAREMLDRGAVLSELHPRTPPRGSGLMARDRIISGLSLAVIVVEAAEESGSLDTARRAIRQGRLLFAVPGSPGTDLLLRDGAMPVRLDSVDLDELADRIASHDPTANASGPAGVDTPQQLGFGF